MKHNYHTPGSSERQFLRKFTVFVFFFVSLLISGLIEGKTQILEDTFTYDAKLESSNISWEESSDDGSMESNLAHEGTFYTHLADVTAPVLVAFNPAIDEIVQPDIGTLSIAFDEAVIFTGSIDLRRDDNTFVKRFTAGTADVTVSGSTITLNNVPTLNDNTEHYVRIDGLGTITDLAGNTYTNWTGRTWEFVASSTGDIEKPFITSFTPETNGIHVSASTDITFVFNENISPGSGSIFLRKNNTNPPITSFAVTDPEVTITNNVMTIDLPTLEFDTRYDLYTLGDGFVVDAVGNSMNQLSSYIFTTAVEGVNPDLRITNFNPIDGINDFYRAGNIEITFTQPIQFGNGFATIRSFSDGVQRVLFEADGSRNAKASISGSTLTLDPDIVLEANTTYYLDIQQGFVEDLSGDEFHGWESTDNDIYVFSTPLATTGNPSDITISSNSIEENAGVNAVVGLFTTTDGNSADTEVYSLVEGVGDTDNGLFNTNGDQLRASQDFDFEIETNYSVRIRSDDGNGGVFEKEFSIVVTNDVGDDPIPPVRVTLSPADNATNVPINSNLIVTFDRPIRKGTTGLGRIFINQNTSGGSVILNRTENNVVVSGSTVTIDPNNDFLLTEDYAITWDPGTFESLNGGLDAGITNSSIWNFTTAGTNTIPSDISLLDGNSFDENQKDLSEGLTEIGTTDPDVGDTHTYTLVAGIGDTDNNDFEIDGNLLQSKAPFDFETQDEYSIRIQTEDQAGATFSKEFTIYVNDIADEIAPVVVSRVPANGAFNVSLTADFSLTFDENVSFENDENTIQLWNATSGMLVESMGFGEVSPTFGSTIGINPTADLLPNTNYYLTISSEGAFVDGSDNYFEGFENPTDWNFSTSAPPDITAPDISSLSPASEAMDVSQSLSTISATFNEPIQFTSTPNTNGGTIQLVDGNTNPVYSFGTADASIIGNELIINTNVVPGGLAGDAFYRVSIFDFFLEDLAGNRYGGTTTNQWRFTIESVDTDGPEVVSLTPADDETGVDRNIDVLTIEFDEPVFNVGASNSVITINSEGTGLAQYSLQFNPASVTGFGTNTITLDLPFAFTPGQDIDIQWVNAFRDADGNVSDDFDSDEDWNFTAETIPVEVIQYFPADNEDNAIVSVQTQLTFNQEVVLGTGNIFLHLAENDNVVATYSTAEINQTTVNNIRFDFPVDILEGTEYYFAIDPGFLTDVSGNDFVGITDKTIWNFKTADNTPPSVASFSPADDATDISVGSSLVITFDEEIQRGFRNTIRLYEKDTDELIVNLPSNSSEIEITGNQIRLEPEDPLKFETEYYVTIGDGFIRDTDLNSVNQYPELVGWSDNETWDFTTTAPNPPVITSVTPDFDSSNPAVVELSVTFDRNIFLDEQSSSAQILRLYRVSDDVGGPIARVGNATITGNRLDMILDFDPYDNEEMYVEFSDFMIRDADGNFFEDLGSDFWRFTSDWDYVERVSLHPDNFSNKFPLDGEIKITYDQAVKKGIGSGGSYTLRKFAGNEIILSLNEDDPRVILDGEDVIFDVNDQLEYNTRYFITALGVPIRGVNNEPTRNFNNNNTFVFTTIPDPAVFAQPVSFTPAPGATGISINTDLTIEFTNPVDVVQGSIQLYERASGDFLTSIDLSLNSTVSGNSVSIELGNPLPYSTEIAVRVSESNFISENTGIFEIVDNDTWFFNTEDPDLPPSVVSFSPADDAENVSVDIGSLTITLSEPIDADASSGTLRIRRVGGNQIIQEFEIGTNEVTIADAVITLENVNQLDPGSSFWVQNFATNIVDLAGNKLAEWNDDETWNFSTETPVLDQTITFSALSDRTYGDPSFTLEAETTSGLEITYESSNQSVATVSGNTVTIIGAGTTSITASQGGDTDYNPAEDVTQSLTITKKVLDVTADDKSKVFGEANPNLTISYDGFVSGDNEAVLAAQPTASTSATTSSNAGTYPITLSGGSDENYEFNLIDGTLTIERADQVISINPISQKETTDGAFDVVATTSSGLALDYTILSGPASISGTNITLDGTAGTVVVEVSQAGDINYNAASQTTSFNVIDPALQNQTITFESIGDKTFGDAPFSLSATASSGLEVVFSIVSGPVSLSGDQVTINGAGTVVIAANQSGNNVFNAAPEVTQTFEIAKADQTISFESIGDKTFGDAPFSLSATASSGLEVAFSMISGPVSLSGDQVTINGAGTVVIATNQSGDNVFNAAPEVTQTFEIAKADQTITITPITDKLTTDVAFDVFASTTSNLELEYDVSGPATISGNTIMLDGTSGTVVVTVSQEGDENFNSSSATESFEVRDPAKQDQSITFNAISDQTYGDQVSLVATASSGLDITYTLNAGEGVINNGVLMIMGIGNYEVIASQEGDETFNPAASMTQQFVVNKAVLTVTADDQTISEGEEIPSLTQTYDGFKLSDDLTVIDTTPSISTTATSESEAGSYPIILTGGVDDVYSFYLIDGTLTIENVLGVNAKEIKVYPNPTTSIINVMGIEFDLLILTDLSGKEVVRSREKSLTVEGITNGIYILWLEQDGKPIHNQMIKIN